MHRLPRAFTLRQQHPLRRQQYSFSRQQHVPRPAQQQQQHRRFQTQLISRETGEPIRTRRVRIKKPRWTLRRSATLGIYIGMAYAYFQLFRRYFEVEVEFLEAEEEEEGAKAGEQDEGKGAELEEGPFYADEDSFFIPLTWSTKLPRTWYKGSDPEWQGFIDFSKEEARHGKVMEELAQIVHKGSTRHRGIRSRMGANATIAKYWLDISFPDGPPPEYERSGIEFGDGFVAWSQQKVTQENQWRLMRALWPTAMAESSWATLKVLARVQYQRLKGAMGFEGGGLGTPAERLKATMDAVKKVREQHEQSGGGTGKTQTDPQGSSAAVVTGSSSSSQPAAPDADQKTLPWAFHVPLPTSSAIRNTDLPIAMHVFSTTLSRLRHAQQRQLEPPKGTIVVQGMVELRGARARVLFDVHGYYDPKQAKYVAASASVRRIKMHRQGAKGGP